MHLIDVLTLLVVAVLFAKVAGGYLQKWGIPVVLVELLVGVFIGNFGGVFHGIESSEVIHGLSELGVLFLLFLVGLETDIKEIGKVGKDATFAAILGVVAPMALAFFVVPMIAKESSFNHTLFMAAALTATSVGITARVLQDTKKLASTSGQIILGAAVIDDVLGIIVLTVVSALVTKGTVSGGELGILFGKVALFGAGVFLFRRLLLNITLKSIMPFEVSGTVTTTLIMLTLATAWLANLSGLEGIIGAFAIGVALDDVHFKGYKETKEYTLEEIMKPITDFLVPIFFVVMGMGVKLSALANAEALTVAAVLIVLAIIGKLACGLGVTAKAARAGGDRLLVGFGMIPRGEVGLIFAAVGQRLGVLGKSDYAAVVAMVAVTTLMAPGLIAWRAKQMDRKSTSRTKKK